MLKILTIHGSPHKGQTYDVTTEFLSRLRNRMEIDVKDVILFQERLALCQGCGICVMHGEERCPAKDRMQEIHSMIRDADATIVTTPVYSLQVTALVKNFIERSSYIMHRPSYFGKWFMSLSTQFIGGDKDVAKYLASVMRFWGFNIIPGLRLTMGQDKNVIGRKINDAVSRFESIGKQSGFPVPTLKDLMMFRFRR
ncbi:MAG: NAD(P)H-dependent oxidoreductase [Elusimicrobia bacterium]|nr:NAD(P)H-dependent oxidoreductase [Elusimicrobiota bacterium]